MSTQIFEKKPRFANCPPICLFENLPSFKTEKELSDWKEANAPGHTIVIKWLCKICNHFHYIANPNQSSSGNPRAFVPRAPRFQRDCPHIKTKTERNESGKCDEKICDECGKIIATIPDAPQVFKKRK